MSAATAKLPFVLRFLELLFSIVAFALVAEYNGASKYDYIIFTGCWGALISIVFLLAYLCGAESIRGKVSAVLDAISWVLWLAAAAVATSLLTEDATDNSRTRASTAFCWLAWGGFHWSLILSVREARACDASGQCPV